MKIIKGVKVFGEPDPGALEQILRCAPDAVEAALMADNHKGYAVPIGGVLAYDGKVSPNGVGYDIACGNKAVKLDMKFEDIKPDLDTVMDAIWHNISFGIGRANKEPVDHPLFDDLEWKLDAVAPLKQMAREQLGTIGSGNHFVDLFVDESDSVWVGVHFGSRGLGHKTATYFLKQGGAKDGMDVEPLLLDVGTALGHDYLEAMGLAGRYAHAGRNWVCERVAKILGAPIIEEVHNNHNYAQFERGLWVVRKGATPLEPGQLSFVGGSMGDYSYILRGKAESGPLNMYSTVHGAGRVMSRGETKRTVPREDMLEWLKRWNVMLRGAGVDESPQAYKRISEVLVHHEESAEIVTVLKPIGVCMAGAHERDPYKD